MNQLLEGARAFGLQLSADQLRAFQIYQDELIAWNQKFNLTSITDPAEIVSKHFLDSLSVFVALQLPTSNFQPPTSNFQPPTSNFQPPTSSLQPPTSNLQLLDVGAGAGFPGLPIKIVQPEWSLTLLEATRKKCDFLEQMIAVLQLKDARVVWGRAETVGHQASEREQYDLVVARAVAELNVLAEYMLPFARVGGQCVAWKGHAIEDEVNAAKKAIEKLGGRLREVKPVTVPGIEQQHHLVVIEKVARTQSAYPRREGVPSKRPLK